MAKAGDTNNTPDLISLRDALALAFAALESMALAKDRIREWLAAGKLRWTCRKWEALDAEGIAKFEQSLREAGIVQLPPSGPYHNGDPRFWGVDPLEINWEDNSAREAVGEGAYARGIRLSLIDLRALLPDEGTRENEEVRGAGEWIAAEAKRMKDANKIPPDIRISEFARKLERRMQEAATTNKSLRPITWRSIKNGLRTWGVWPIDSIK